MKLCILHEPQQPDLLRAIDVEQVKRWMQEHQEVEYQWPNNNVLMIAKDRGTYHKLGELEYVSVKFGEYFEFTQEDRGFNVTGTEYFKFDQLELAAKAFVTRLNSDFPSKTTNTGTSLIDIAENR